MKGMAFTGERERVQIFLSLAAYGDENWIMVEAPNTIDVAVGCQMCMGDRDIFFRKDGCWYLQILLDAWWHVRSCAMFTRYGRSWSPYCDRCLETRGGLTVWEFLAAPTILCVRVAAEHCFV